MLHQPSSIGHLPPLPAFIGEWGSLLGLSQEAQPEAVTELGTQHRMAADIMLLPNETIYNNRLRCASEAVATRILDLPSSTAAHGGASWLPE
eukprot:gene4142-5120_t